MSVALGTITAIERLRAGRATTLQIGGVSMEPLFKAGQPVDLCPCTMDELKPGDLVAFERDDRLVLHRVLEIGDTFLIEKGDNAPAPTRVESCDVLGTAHGARCGRVAARISAWHGRLHSIATNYPRSRLHLAMGGVDATLRLLRRLALKR